MRFFPITIMNYRVEYKLLYCITYPVEVILYTASNFEKLRQEF